MITESGLLSTHVKIAMVMQKYLFVIPFFCFIVSYSIMYKVCVIRDIKTPYLIGKYTHEALSLVAQNDLTIKLMEQKEDVDIPEGIIINQIPSAESLIRSGQSIFVVTTKKPQKKPVLQYVGLTIDDIIPLCEKAEVKYHIHYVSHLFPRGTCFAQYPQQGQCIEKNTIILYISSGNNKPVIWPRFIGKNVGEVSEFLCEYGMEPHIVCNTPNAVHAVVVDQRPMAGTLLTLDDQKAVSVHLRVQ